MRWGEHLPTRPRVVIVPAVRRLSIYGSYVLELRPWTNALPPQGVTAEALVAFWEGLVATAEASVARRQRSGEELAAAERQGQSALFSTLVQVRYSGKIELKTFFSIVVALHRVLAPAERHVCASGCAHMKQGASPAQCKAFTDALDAAAAHTERYREEGSNSQVSADLGEEGYLYRRYRREFVELLGPPFPAPPPLPPPDSELWAPRLRRSPEAGAGQPPPLG